MALALTGLAFVLGLMTVTWAISVLRRDASLVDRVWGLAFVVLGWVYVVALKTQRRDRFWQPAW